MILFCSWSSFTFPSLPPLLLAESTPRSPESCWLTYDTNLTAALITHFDTVLLFQGLVQPQAFYALNEVTKRSRTEQSRALCARCQYDRRLPRPFFIIRSIFLSTESTHKQTFPDFPQSRWKTKFQVLRSSIANEKKSFAVAVGSSLAPPQLQKK